MSSSSRTLTSTVPSRRSDSAGTGAHEDMPIALLRHELIDVDSAALLLRSSKLCQLKNEAGAKVYSVYCRLLELGLYLGYIPVSYRVPRSGFGSYTSRVSIDDGQGDMPMLSTIHPAVRAILADKHYVEVGFGLDSHPVILAQLLSSYQIECPQLTHYIEHLDVCVSEVAHVCGISKETAQELFHRLSYLGSPEAWMLEVGTTNPPPDWVGALSAEMEGNASRIVQRPELDSVRLTKVHDLRQGARISQRLTASIMLLYLQTLERRCVDALQDAIERDGFMVGALNHNGVHVLRGGGDAGDCSEISSRNICNWKAAVCVTAGYDLEVRVKSFELDSSWFESSNVPHDAKWDKSWMNGACIMGYPRMKVLWEERAFKVVVCGDFVREEREKHAVYTRRKLLDAYEHLKTFTVKYRANGEGTLIPSSFMKIWLQDQHMRTYEYMGTYPPPMICPRHTYNCWTGSPQCAELGLPPSKKSFGNLPPQLPTSSVVAI